LSGSFRAPDPRRPCRIIADQITTSYIIAGNRLATSKKTKKMAKRARIAKRLGREERDTPLSPSQSDHATIANAAIAHADVDSHHAIISGQAVARLAPNGATRDFSARSSHAAIGAAYAACATRFANPSFANARGCTAIGGFAAVYSFAIIGSFAVIGSSAAIGGYAAIGGFAAVYDFASPAALQLCCAVPHAPPLSSRLPTHPE
jgi:hypothetical protein